MFSKIATFFDKHLGILFLIPGMIIMALIIVYPIATNIYLSFTNSHLLMGISKTVGFDNYLSILKDPDFLQSLYTTLIWTVCSVVLQLILGMVSALLLNHKKIRAKGIFRTLIYVPYTLPIIVVTILWRWMLNGVYGVVNHFLLALGLISKPISWLSNSTTVIPSLVVMNSWFGYPLMALSILAGLQTIPDEFYEVAQIEGASYFQTFRKVILPSIKRIVVMMLILRTIWIFNTFDMVFMTTGGGPSRATEILTIFGYNLGWRRYLIGRTAALSVILLIILFILISMYMRGFRMEAEE